jgi:polysaccharide export outer membrane protein
MFMRSLVAKAVCLVICTVSLVMFTGDAWGAEPRAAVTGVRAPEQEKSKAARGHVPRELSMRPLPSYRIQPPDLIQVEMLKQVPLPPYRVQVYDVLQIQVVGALENQPIDGYYLIAAEGVIDLGPAYGNVRVVGMTIDEIKRTTGKKLREILKNPEVSVQLARTSGTQPVTGTYLVAPDGTINLRQYGSVLVSDKTLAEARLAIQKQLGEFFDSPEVTVDVTGYNSKVYYIITEGANQGDNVVRVPIAGNETVLDAISQIGGLSQSSSKKIWIARPSASDAENGTILPVDWDAITRRAATATNYQIMPGDRVFVAEDCLVALNNWLTKVSAPAERVLGLIGLAKSALSAPQQ